MHTTVGEIGVAYDTLGEATDPPVVLISGLGAQLIAWDDAFCQQLVDRGLFVIRFDNRDVGLSSHLVDRPTSDPSAETTGAAPAATPEVVAKRRGIRIDGAPSGLPWRPELVETFSRPFDLTEGDRASGKWSEEVFC